MSDNKKKKLDPPVAALRENIISSSHKFMNDLYRVLAEDEENTFFSSFSIYVALVLAYLGSNGETARELQKCLHLPENKEDVLKGLQSLLKELQKPQLSIATEMFIEKSYKVRTSYKNAVKKLINSESQLVDFKEAYEEARKLINTWVSSKTRDKIKDLIPEGTYLPTLYPRKMHHVWYIFLGHPL